MSIECPKCGERVDALPIHKCRTAPPVPYIEFNKMELRAEEADCVEAYLDSIDAPKHDSHCDENMYSLVGRITHISAPPVPDTRWEIKYNELIMEVVNKIPNETRHETALRIIRQYENRENSPMIASQDQPDGSN